MVIRVGRLSLAGVCRHWPAKPGGVVSVQLSRGAPGPFDTGSGTWVVYGITGVVG